MRPIDANKLEQDKANTKVWCAEIECKYHTDDNICAAKEINIAAGHMHTVHAGYCHVWTCRTFEQTPESKELFDMLKGYFDKKIQEENGERP